MSQLNLGPLRAARSGDIAQLMTLWELLWSDEAPAAAPPWTDQAREWFARSVDDSTRTWLPVIDIDGEIVAAAIGTVEIGIPNPYSPTGRGVRLANVITLPEHRGKGYGTMLVRDVIAWARTVQADRVDLSATPAGQRVYEQIGFTLTSSPRMKLVL